MSYFRPPELQGKGLHLLIVLCTAAIIGTLIGIFRPEWFTVAYDAFRAFVNASYQSH